MKPERFPFSAVIASMLAGQLVNLLLPLRAGDVLRSVLLGRAVGSSASRVLGSVAAEKVWDWLALTVLVLMVGWLAPLPAWFGEAAWSLGLLATSLLAGLGLLVTQQRRALMATERLLARLPERFRRSVVARLGRLLDGMNSLRSLQLARPALVWSLATWCLGAATNYLVMRAFGVDSWPGAMFLLIMLMIGIALPPSIAALGIFEAASILALGVFGVRQEMALAIGLILHMLVAGLLLCAATVSIVVASRMGQWHGHSWASAGRMTVTHD
jgi:uncharacterized protein (TIRG00374 family)